MRKFIAAFFTIILLICLFTPSVYAAAEPTPYELEGIVRIGIPADWMVIMQSTSPDDPVFSKINQDGDTIIAGLKSKNIYLDAFTINPKRELAVIILDNPQISSLTNYSDAALNDLADSLMKYANSAGAGASYWNYTLYTHPDARFIVFDGMRSSVAGSVYVRQYFTILNNKTINVTLHNYYGGMIPESDKQLLQSIVSATSFGSSPAPAATAAVSAALTPTPAITQTSKPAAAVSSTGTSAGSGTTDLYFLAGILVLGAAAVLITMIQKKKRENAKYEKHGLWTPPVRMQYNIPENNENKAVPEHENTKNTNNICAQPVQKVRCGQCSAEVPAGSIVCPRCGDRIY